MGFLALIAIIVAISLFSDVFKAKKAGATNGQIAHAMATGFLSGLGSPVKRTRSYAPRSTTRSIKVASPKPPKATKFPAIKTRKARGSKITWTKPHQRMTYHSNGLYGYSMVVPRRPSFRK
jgi:hypothetical protein